MRPSTRSIGRSPRNGLAEERGVGEFALHGESSGQKIVGRVLAKGLAGDEMGERVHLIVDGIDGRVHHIEFKDASRIEEVGRDMIVEAAPVASGPRPADRNIASNAEADNGIYRPSRHLERLRDSLRDSGFGSEVNKAMSRRARRLVEMDLATAKDGKIHIPVGTVATLERQEVERVGHEMARERGLTYLPANAGEYVSGRLAGHIAGLQRDDGGIEWTLGRDRGLSL